jgi:hypothetical protein
MAGRNRVHGSRTHDRVAREVFAARAARYDVQALSRTELKALEAKVDG